MTPRFRWLQHALDLPITATLADLRSDGALHAAMVVRAFDFAAILNDDWVMLECNPAGQWLWIQDEADVKLRQESLIS